MSRGRVYAVVGLVVCVTACGPTLPSDEAAAVFVVEDMLQRIPAEGDSIARRVIAEEWQGPPPAGPVSPAAVAASHLEARRLAVAARSDTATLVLNLFRPVVEELDTYRVVAEWLIYTPGELFWGTQWVYRLRCAPQCVLLERHGPGYLN